MLTAVADGVLIHQSALLQNKTVVVVGDEGVLVVDPGLTAAEMRCLADDLRPFGPVAAGFATHPDWDHVLWHPFLGDALRYGTAAAAAFLEEFRSHTDWRDRAREALPPEIAEDVPLEPFGLITGLPPGTARLPWNGPEVRMLEHSAHAVGHAALVVATRRVLIGGDMLSDLFVPMPDIAGAGDPVADYLAGLRVLEDVAGAVDVFIPGHGSVCDAVALRERIARDRAYMVPPGWEWVGDLHATQVAAYARRAEGTPGES